MKVKIGKYITYHTVSNITQKIAEFFGANDDRQHDIGEYVAKKLPAVDNLLDWIYERRQRTIKVRIDSHDTWSLDHTLSHIIYPALVEYNKQKHSYFLVSDEQDVPEYLRLSSFRLTEKELEQCEKFYDPPKRINNLYQMRYEYVMSRMIWSFEQISKDNDGLMGSRHGTNEYRIFGERLDEGFKLFGKYYRNLWD